MSRIWHLLKRYCGLRRLAGLAVLAGATGTLSACYGNSVPVTPNPKFAIDILEFTYTPASPVQVGDNLVFQATTDRTNAKAHVLVSIYQDGVFHQIQLRDDGVAPDATAFDKVWNGEQEWLADWGTVNQAYVRALVTWDNGYISGNSDGPPLTVLPTEDGA